jgi:hypothetical protein
MAPSIERARSSRNWLRYWATTGMPASTACRTRADPTWPMAPVMRSAISGARDNRVNEPAGCDGPCGVPLSSSAAGACYFAMLTPVSYGGI